MTEWAALKGVVSMLTKYALGSTVTTSEARSGCCIDVDQVCQGGLDPSHGGHGRILQHLPSVHRQTLSLLVLFTNLSTDTPTGGGPPSPSRRLFLVSRTSCQ